MLTGHLAQKTLWRLLQHSQASLISRATSHAHLVSVSVFSKCSCVITGHNSCYSVMACGVSVNLCNCNTNKPSVVERPYQVVVAATRDMGIGKDGKLPWNLPSDLKFFKEVTTNNSIPGKRNAVIMGRKTWESIPPKYQPLPGRLNVVLTRTGKLEAAKSEDLVICSNLPSALKLMAEPPHSLSVEKVFVIGGGQVLRDALNGPGCEVIHLTDIMTNIECDTFIPRINLSMFQPQYTSGLMVENNIQFSFVTYVRASISSDESSAS